MCRIDRFAGRSCRRVQASQVLRFHVRQRHSVSRAAWTCCLCLSSSIITVQHSTAVSHTRSCRSPDFCFRAVRCRRYGEDHRVWYSISTATKCSSLFLLHPLAFAPVALHLLLAGPVTVRSCRVRFPIIMATELIIEAEADSVSQPAIGSSS